jgi:hypothetical protein
MSLAFVTVAVFSGLFKHIYINFKALTHLHSRYTMTWAKVSSATCVVSHIFHPHTILKYK